MAVAVGVLVFLVLFPFAGDDSDPPTFFSVFGHEVPTDNPLLAIAGGVVAGALTWLATGRLGEHGEGEPRRREPEEET